MFLNIFSVTLSEDYIAYFLLHFTYPLRQVSSTKPCILVCRIRVLSAIRKEFLRCRFFFPPPLQAEKSGGKADAFGHFRVHENGKRTFFRPANRAKKTAAQPRRNLPVSVRNVITETVFQYRNPVRDSLPFRISVSIPDIRYTQPVLRTETAFQVRLYTQTILLY